MADSRETFRVWLPIVAGMLASVSYFSHIVRMWAYHTAAGQSLIGWIAISIDLGLWFAYYKICLPAETFAKWTTATLMVLAIIASASVLWWRMHA